MSLEFNKVAAAVLTAGVVAMFSSFIGRELFHSPHMEGQAYQIASVGGHDAGGGGEQPAAPTIDPILPLLASADPAKGEAVFKACAACHTADKGGANKVGPNLWDIVNRPHAAHEGFAYSDALKAFAGKPWTYEEINHFVANPKSYAPGTKMTFGGVKKVQDRADLVAYLRTLSDNPAPLPTQEEIDALQKAEAPAEGATEGGTEAAHGATTTGEAATAESGTAESGTTAESGATEGTTQTADAGGGDLIAAIGAADPAEGQKIFKVCTACHSADKDGANKVGPNLWGVVGGPFAHKEDFNYSAAFQEAKAAGRVWTYADLDHYLTNPKEFLPGNKMTFAGVKKPEQRAALIAFLRSMADTPAPLE